MRIPFLRPKPEAAKADFADFADPVSSAKPAKPAKPARARTKPSFDEPADIEAARTQARRRLVGALVLLLIGVVGFPILFETQPRPLPMDTPIEAVRRDTASSGAVITESVSERPAVVSMPPVDAGNDVPPTAASAVAASKPVVVAVPKPPAADKPSISPSAPAASATATAPAAPPAGLTVSTARAASGAVAVVAAAPKAIAPAATIPASPTIKAAAPPPVPASPPAPTKPPAKTAATPAPVPPAAAPAVPGSAAAPAGQRFVVQAGAYSDAAKLREARAKIERLGLKTYTQVIDSDKGSRTRVRVGPFESRAEAEAVAEKIKRGGVPSAILAL